MHPLRAVRGAMSGEHYHHGVLQLAGGRADWLNFNRGDRFPLARATGGGSEITMAEENKERLQGPANAGIDRREFFVRIGLGSMGIAAAGTAVFGYQFLSPNVLYEPSP